ncbi:MAG: hypothetical protein M3416_05170, partial [Acidobacteriota bacterium]|nr:hypothetical protein [Acidobacteriota bacterium]
PPPGLEWQVRRCLRLLDPSHLEGLAAIYLQDELPDTPVREDQAEWLNRVCVEGLNAHVSGWYAAAGADNPAGIMLYARSIYRGIPFILHWSTAPTLCLLRTLAHEVAHHLVSTRGYVFHAGEDVTDGEALAERYAASVEQRVVRQWRYRLGRFWLKEIAGWYYAFGNVEWREKNYQAAVRYFLNAWHLDPEHELAGYWYWRAKEMLGTGPK